MMCSLVFHRKLGYFLSCRMLPCILLLVRLWCALNHINKLYIPNDASNGLFLSTCPPLTTGWWHLVYHTSHCWWSYDWNVDAPNFGTDMNRSWLANRSRLLNHLLLILSFTSPCNNHNLSIYIYRYAIQLIRRREKQEQLIRHLAKDTNHYPDQLFSQDLRHFFSLEDLGLEVHPQHYAGKRILDLHCLPGPLQHLGLNKVPGCPVVTVVKKSLFKA